MTDDVAKIAAGLSDADKTEAIHTALIAQVSDKEIFASEMAFSGGQRRIDLWKISAHRSKGFEATAYEIKVSRADFKRDTAIKQREARLYSDKFYYVTPTGLIDKNDLPEWAGLMEWNGDKFSLRVPAIFRDKDGPTWELVTSLIRNSGKINRDTDKMKMRLRYAEAQLREAKAEIIKMGRRPYEFGIHD